jgi:4-alpha-glucanotransferase
MGYESLMSDAWSITEGFWDIGGTWHPTTEATRRALLVAMDADDGTAPPPPPAMWFLAGGAAATLADPCDLVLEDGTTLPNLRALPPDLPLGYHDLHPQAGGPTTRLVITPRRCPLPARTWGWAVQLYALRSATSWGIGDLVDLRRLADWSRRLGAGIVMINPLHAAAPGRPQQPSPYSPTSRLWRNLAYLGVPELPGASAIGAELAALDEAGRALNATDRIDRDAVHRLKVDALTRLHAAFERGTDHAAFDMWVGQQGVALERFAVWCVLAERYGPEWSTWPAAYRHPASAAVAALARAERVRVRFHQWCQWQLATQLGAAATAVDVVADLAVGFDPDGADAWSYQDILGRGCRVGAPPDAFNPLGQDWGLPPFVPWKLRQDRYQPFIDTIRASLAHCGGLRIDHVMGLFRLYWIPPGVGPADGAYVRYPHHDLLDLLALEAHRAGAFVVGEDLGTVEDDVREELADRAILSYRLVWFEEGPPPTFPRQALAGVTTHDLPTMAGVWSGADLAERRRLGRAGDGSDDTWFRSRIHLATGLGDDASTEEVVVATHEALAEAPSLIVVATLDDAIGMVERPNLPGTIDEWPNWRIPLRRTLEEIETDPLVLAVAGALDAGVRHQQRADLPSPP